MLILSEWGFRINQSYWLIYFTDPFIFYIKKGNKFKEYVGISQTDAVKYSLNQSEHCHPTAGGLQYSILQ